MPDATPPPPPPKRPRKRPGQPPDQPPSQPPGPKPGHRRRKDARPAEILDAGLAEFAEAGFAGARLSAVAKRAGISKGTIYLYFDSKEALFDAALTSRLTPTLADLADALAAWPGSSADLLRLIVTRLHAKMHEPDVQALLRIIIAEGPRFPHIAEAYHRQIIAKGRALLSGVIARGVARGELRDGPAARLPMIVVAPALMATIWRTTFDPFDPIPREAFLEAHIDLILHGLAATPG
jgi:AcrR family transcriptional regulator